MGKSYQVRENVFVLPVDMENRSVEDIARDAVASIMEVCDQVGKQREAERKAREEIKRMSSITVRDMKNLLEDVPDDYQVVMVLTKKKKEEKAVLSMVNGFQVLDREREVRLLN